MTELQAVTERDLAVLPTGRLVTRTPKFWYLMSDARIRSAWRQFERGAIIASELLEILRGEVDQVQRNIEFRLNQDEAAGINLDAEEDNDNDADDNDNNREENERAGLDDDEADMQDVRDLVEPEGGTEEIVLVEGIFLNIEEVKKWKIQIAVKCCTLPLIFTKFIIESPSILSCFYKKKVGWINQTLRKLDQKRRFFDKLKIL